MKNPFTLGDKSDHYSAFSSETALCRQPGRSVMKVTTGIILLLVTLLSTTLLSQKRSADSLMNLIPNLQGTSKVDALNQLADIYQYMDTRKAIETANQGLELAKRINYQKGIAANLGSLGFCYLNLDHQKAVEYTKRALHIRKKIGDKAGIATSLNLMGVLYYYSGDYLPAIDYHLQGLKLREEIGDRVKIATSYNNIALIHIALEEYTTALNYLKKALKVRIETGDRKGMGIISDNLGDVYSKLQKYDAALKYFSDALAINKEIGNRKSEANSYFNIAAIYKKLNDQQKAFYYLKDALKIYVELDEKKGISNSENAMAELYLNAGKCDSAVEHSLVAYSNAILIDAKSNISRAAEILQECYARKGDYKNAYKYSRIYQDILNETKSSDKIKKLAKIEYQYKFDKMKREQEAEMSRQSTFIQLLGITLSLSIVIILLIVYGYRHNRRTNIQLNEFNEKLKEANAAKDRFFSIIAHDLRGPFQSLLGASGVLVSEVDCLEKDDIKKLGDGINTSLQKQYGLLNDLLEWSRLQNGSFSLSYEDLPVYELVEEIVPPFYLSLSNKNISFRNNTDKSAVVHADRQMLQLVLRNLISNSIKFTNTGGWIEVSNKESGKYMEITVTDNGIGICEEELKELFRIDKQHSTKGTQNEVGSGLGLILCKEIMDRHEGSIRAEGRKGCGCKFTVVLPITRREI